MFNDPDDFDELRNRLTASAAEIGIGQLPRAGRVRVSGGEVRRNITRLSSRERSEYEERMIEREKAKEREWADWILGSGPPPEPIIKAHVTHPRVEPRVLPEIDEARLSEIRERAYERGAPWNTDKARATILALEHKRALIDERLIHSLGGGRSHDWNQWEIVSDLLGRAGIGQEAGLTGFGETWRLSGRFRAIYDRWLVSRSLILGQTLTGVAVDGRIIDPVLLAALSPERYGFSDLSVRLLIADWLDSIRRVKEPGQTLLVISWKAALPALAAWLTGDRYLAEAIRSDRLYAEVAGDSRGLALAPQAMAVAAWLHGCFTGESVRSFLGECFGFSGEPEPLEDQMRSLNYESSLATIDWPTQGYVAWLGAQKAEFTTALEPSDYDAEFARRYGPGERREMRRFRPDRFQAHIEGVLADLRYRGIATLLGGISDEFKIVGCIRDSVIIESEFHSARDSARELARAGKAALQAAFPGIPIRLQTGVGQSWLEARSPTGMYNG